MAAVGAMGIAMIASTALSAGATIYSTMNARNQAKAQSQQAEQNARNAESQGRVEANRILELGQKQKSAAQAQMAANGLDLSADNTIVDTVESDIDLNSSKDAWTTFFNHKNQSAQYMTDASAYKAQAKNATVSGILNLGSTALSAYGSTPKNAYGSKTTTQPTSSIPSNALAMDTSRIKQNASGWA